MKMIFLNNFGGFGVVSGIMVVSIVIIFIVIIIANIIRGFKNNNSPRLTVDALTLKRKRVDSINADGTSFTDYYAIFQVESGDKMRFYINRYEYSELVEGEHGKLSFQGTRYLGFKKVTM